ncbi:MAG: succinate dehydrogenase [Acidobacteria bacterium]|jgi:succinate dehydrogenase / fumarate reductase cytochrome b subunit|nr:succinate dehydrogenase [Acidobacteriota bacterium]MBA4123218.1 succinate dehydrogenase [Acidobacteriota bacterium]
MAIKISRTFLLRKLHQITGIAPLGIYFLVHMYTNSTAMSGEQVFEDHVTDIHHLPYLLFIEIFGIFLPLLFHSVYGIIISAEARPNGFDYNYGRNWFYIFQRVTGIFLFFFLTFHILNLRFGMIPGLNLTAVAGHADQAFNIVSREFQITWVFIFYVLGVTATAWHLAYGIFLFAVDWGILIGERAQKMALYACVGLAFFLSVVGINAMVAFNKKCGLLPSALCEEAEKKGVVEPNGSKRF